MWTCLLLQNGFLVAEEEEHVMLHADADLALINALVLYVLFFFFSGMAELGREVFVLLITSFIVCKPPSLVMPVPM
jgi:hypothetical protein